VKFVKVALISLILVACGTNSVEMDGGQGSEFVPTLERPFENCTVTVKGPGQDGSKIALCQGGPDTGLRYEWPAAKSTVQIRVTQVQGALDITYYNGRGGTSEERVAQTTWSKDVTVNAGSYFSVSARHFSVPVVEVVAKGLISIKLSVDGEEFSFCDGYRYVSCDGSVPTRGAGQEITGFDPGNDARVVLASARDAVNQGDFGLANSLFARVVQMEREREVDNVEAITYFGWTLALQSVQDPDAESSDQRLDAARVALRQAIELDDDYADPNCFLAIIEFNFFDDADAALTFVNACEEKNPTSDMEQLVAGFAAEIRAAAG
jgi:hypothetical protein